MDEVDKALLSRFFEGNQEALDQLVKKYLPLIYRYVYRLVGNEEFAEELTQETFIRCWKNLNRFNLEKPFKPWLYRIARNCAFDHLRKKNILPFTRLSEPELFKIENTESSQATPEEVARQKENSEQVHTLLSRLSELENEILTLHYLEELTVPEISEIMKKPEETIRTRLRRARQAFRDEHQNSEPSDHPDIVSI